VNFDINEGFELHKDKNFIKLIQNQNNPDKMKVKIVNEKKFFEIDFTRIKPFILAKRRYVLKNMQNLLQNILNICIQIQ
jgi:hypothetical protein